MAHTQQTYINTVFKILASGLFLFQMYHAVIKFVNMPEVNESSVTTTENIMKPLMYVCDDDQFKYDTARKYGYQDKTSYVVGKLNGSENPSWIGNSINNSSADELLESVHNFNYNDVHVIDGDNEKIPTEQLYIHPYGFCIKILNFRFDKAIDITSKHEVRFYILDPYKSSLLRVEEALGHSTNLNVKKDKFEYNNFKVSYTLHDESIHDGKTCTDYTNKGSTYGECIVNEMNEKLMEWFDCIPPWFYGKMTKCVNSSKPHNEKALIFLAQFILNSDMESRCLPSCLSVQMNFMRVFKINNFPDAAVLNVRHDKTVQVYRKVHSYDMFSLVVEIGSALGLWMGLSAVAILDNVIGMLKTIFKHF